MAGSAVDRLVAALGLRLEQLEICPRCLFGVACALRDGDERELRHALRFFTDLLWDEGLEKPLKTALSRAQSAGVPDAKTAAREVEALGPGSRFVEAVVQDLARQQLEETERARAASLN